MKDGSVDNKTRETSQMAQKEGQQADGREKEPGYLDELTLGADTKRAAIGGSVAAAVALTGMIVVNVSTGSEARLLLEGMLPSIRFLCSAVMTASATILALMLTLLSFSSAQSGRLKTRHYNRVRQIAQVDSATFAAALVLLLLVSIPLAEPSEVPANWYSIVYYLAVFYAAGLGGALITVVLMLYNAITDLIVVINPSKTSDLVTDAERKTGRDRSAEDSA